MHGFINKSKQQLWNSYRSKTHLDRIISRTYLNLYEINCSSICRHVIYSRRKMAGLSVTVVGKATLIENSLRTRKRGEKLFTLRHIKLLWLWLGLHLRKSKTLLLTFNYSCQNSHENRCDQCF